jgi:hypothetical protein
VRILLDLKTFVFIHICKCGFQRVYRHVPQVHVPQVHVRQVKDEEVDSGKLQAKHRKGMVFYAAIIPRAMA